MLKWKTATAAVLSIAMLCAAMPAAAFAVEESAGVQEELLQQDEEESIPEEPVSSDGTGAEENSYGSVTETESDEDSNKPYVMEDDQIGENEKEETAEFPYLSEELIEENKNSEEEPSEDPSGAKAEEPVEEARDPEIRKESEEVLLKKSTVDIGDTDDLFEEYANRIFYPNSGMFRKAGNEPAVSTGSKLTGLDFDIYTRLKERASAVAEGEESETTIEIPFSELGIEDRMYSAEELGLTTPLVDESTGKLSQAAKDAMHAKADFDFDKVTACVAADCPYELYWSSGSFGHGVGLSYYYYSEGVNFSDSTLFVYIYVNPKYSESEGDDTRADINKTAAASNAAETARQIVDNAENMEDLEKLTYYKEEICGMVSYNYSAADGDSPVDNGPWALIYVFDGDPDTNVVCEGYSEAFQYLGSLTHFNSGRVCVYSVTGMMDGDTGEGPHKWNIVRMNDGLNYIADITNSDEDSIGSDGKLFLTGVTGNPADCYVREWEEREETVDNGDGSYTIYTYPGGSVTYVYDEEMYSIFTEAELTLSDHDYAYIDTGVEIISQPENLIVKAGETAEFTVEATGEDLHYQWQWSRDGEQFTDCRSEGFDTDTFSFTMKSTMSNRWYRCVVWNDDNEVCSEPAKLTLRTIKITQQPESTTAKAGDTITISVECETDNPVYQWQWSQNGTIWKNCSSIGYNEGTLSFIMKESFANRQYRCMITDESLKVYSHAAVIKLSGPEIIRHPQNVFAQTGGQVSFVIEAQGNGLQYQWQWSQNGTTWKNCSSSGAQLAAFSFSMKENFDGRKYRCVVKSDGRSLASDPATLTLVTPPAIAAHPQDVAAAAGDTVSFSVEVIGDNPVYQWQFSSDGKTWKNCASKGYNTTAFSFPMKSNFAGRKYRCVVSCEGKTLISEYGNLTLK